MGNIDFKFFDYGPEAEASIDAAIQMGLTMNAEEFIYEANQIIPELTGKLKNSGKITHDPAFPQMRIVSWADDTTIRGGSDNNYGYLQHVGTYTAKDGSTKKFRHPDPTRPNSKSGRKDRWVERTERKKSAGLVRKMIAILSNANGSFRTKSSQNTWDSMQSQFSSEADILMGDFND